jgi:DNA-binding winged helix-turn-helix (wHTH) protein/TolB-like protein/tetratricopeptide (TPR) repeat protein
MSERSHKIYEFGDFRFEAAEQILRSDGELVPLTPKVFELLLVLVENHGHLLSKDELIKTLWAESFVEEANLNVTVSALRKVLGEKPNENRFIETVPRRGYRFIAEVREIAGARENRRETDPALTGAATPPIDLPAKRCPQCRRVYTDEALNFCLDDGAALAAEIDRTHKSLSIRLQKNAKVWLALGGILLAVLAGALIWKFAFDGKTAEVSNIRTLAVLPFKPLAGSQSDGALEIGMADALITRLSSIQQITVRPTSAISKYTQPATDPLAAGRELQVEAVLDGKIQRADNKIRVTVQLLRVADGATLWAETFDDFFTNIFAVQDSISEKMTASLALKISGREKERLTRRATENTDAYALYLQARYYHEQISEEGSRRAVEYYEAALEKDPEYALAYAWAVGAVFHLANLGINREENLRKAREFSLKAETLDPNLSDAHEASATVKDALDWNWTEAENEYRRAIELDPKNPDAHYSYAIFLSRFRDRSDEALREIETAKRLNPVAIYMQTEAVIILLRARRFDEALAAAKKIPELKPDFQSAYFLLTRLYIFKSMPEEAERALKKYLALSGSKNQYLTAFVYSRAGKKAEAEKILRALVGKFKEGDNYSNNALCYALLGERDRAFEFLEKAYARREVEVLTLAVEPEWDELRADPRFQNLINRIGLSGR